MLFNSLEFIFYFLPLTLALFYLARYYWGMVAAQSVLILASLFFYGWWNPNYVPLVLISITGNYLLGQAIQSRRSTHAASAKPAIIALLSSGIALNLLALGYFKYTLFFAENFGHLLGTDFILQTIVLPLAISFFTFQQIAYLVDCYKGLVEPGQTRFHHYCLFVLFFPQLIAGPIVHHREIIPQFLRAHEKRINWHFISVGISIFFVGLFKKVVLADTMASFADPVFADPAFADPAVSAIGGASTVAPIVAWGAILAYTLQIYFDFSGYSDMAFGLACLFGIQLPFNFLSPYRSANIGEFWRRWHITLGRFFRDYIYIPLGGGRANLWRVQLNVLAVMLLCGLWHGASWTFVLWGLAHGSGMAVANLWAGTKVRFSLSSRLDSSRLYRALSVVTTFAFVVLCWVLFRCDSAAQARAFYSVLFALDMTQLAVDVQVYLKAMADWLVNLPSTNSVNIRPNHNWANWVLLSLGIVFLAPNAFSLFMEDHEGRLRIGGQAFSLPKAVLVGSVAAYAIAIVFTATASDFIYFIF